MAQTEQSLGQTKPKILAHWVKQVCSRRHQQVQVIIVAEDPVLLKQSYFIIAS